MSRSKHPIPDRRGDGAARGERPGRRVRLELVADAPRRPRAAARLDRPAATATATPAAAKGASIGIASGPDGKYLTGAGGRAVYLWVADSSGMSSCSGACAKAWPPLTTTGKPIAGSGVKASRTSARSSAPTEARR